MPALTASSACFNSCAEIACDKYSSPQLSQTSAGTSLTTIVVSALSRVAVMVPGWVCPCLHTIHFIVISSFQIRVPIVLKRESEILYSMYFSLSIVTNLNLLWVKKGAFEFHVMHPFALILFDYKGSQ